MEDYSGLYLDDETARRQKAMAMARALRGQQETANFDSLAGFDDLAKQGFSNVASGQQALEGAARAGAQRQLQMALAKQAEDARAEEGRLDRAAAYKRAKLGAGPQNPLVIITGQDGSQYFVDPRNPRAPAQPIVDQEGAPVLKTQPGEKGTNIAGLQKIPGADPTTEDAKKVKQSMAAANRMKNYVSELRDLHSKYGTEYGGQVGNRMEQLTKQIQIEGKNIAELGALSGPDMGLMTSLVQADPGSFGSNVKALFGSDNTQNALTGLEKWVDDTLAGNKSAYGYQDATQGGMDLTKAPKQNPHGTFKVLRNKSTGEMKRVYADGHEEVMGNG